MSYKLLNTNITRLSIAHPRECYDFFMDNKTLRLFGSIEKNNELFNIGKLGKIIGKFAGITKLFLEIRDEMVDLYSARLDAALIFQEKSDDIKQWSFFNSNSLLIPEKDLLDTLNIFGEDLEKMNVSVDDRSEIAKALSLIAIDLKVYKNTTLSRSVAEISTKLNNNADMFSDDERNRKFQVYKNYNDLIKGYKHIDNYRNKDSIENKVRNFTRTIKSNYLGDLFKYYTIYPYEAASSGYNNFINSIRSLNEQIPPIEELVKPDAKFRQQQNNINTDGDGRLQNIAPLRTVLPQSQNVTNNNINNTYHINNTGIDINKLLETSSNIAS